MIRRTARLEDAPLLFFLLCAAGFTWAVRQDPFFWDTIQLASKHAHFFYGQKGAWEVLPPEIDSGHPPFLGYYLAALWAFFGKTLAVGHWGMLPFLLMIVWMLYRLARRIGGVKWAFWIMPLALLDPVLLGQSAMVSPDIILAAFFLCSLDGIIGRNKILITIGIAGLCLVSMRGMMCAAALLAGMFLTDRPALLHKTWLAFIPGFAFAGLFLGWHYWETGWIGYHAGSPWAPAFRQAGVADMLRNVAILAWRWLDFGRICEWLVVVGLFWYTQKKTPRHFPFERKWLLLLLCLFVLLSVSAIRYNNLSAHRYFLPVFLAFHLFVFQWIVKTALFSDLAKKWVLTLLSLSFATGNFQVYPHGISMDWDSTLAHLPYHRVQAAGMEYLEQQQIPLSAVGTAFPNINTGENISLNGEKSACVEIDNAHNSFIFISNVFNDVSKEDRKALQQSWRLVWQAKSGAVWGEIYRK